MKIDNLAEINRAATLEASKALSRLIDAPVVVGTVHFEVKKTSELFRVIDPEESVVAVEIPLSGDIKGETMLLMPVETGLGLSDLLLKRERGTSQTIDLKEEGVLNETANIVIGNYLKEFAHALPESTTLLHGLSHLSSGPYSTLTRTLASSLLPYEGEGLLIEITFGFQSSILKGYVILVFAGVEWSPGSLLKSASKEISLFSISREAAERASQALSKLAKREVAVEVFRAEAKKIGDLRSTLPLEEPTFCVYLQVQGDLHGAAALLLSDKDSLLLADLLVGRGPGSSTALSGFDESALKEVGNILVGNYLTVIGDRLQVQVIEGVPHSRREMLGAVLEQVVTNLTLAAEELFFIEIGLRLKPLVVRAQLLILFEVAQVRAILASLGGGGVGGADWFGQR